MVLGSIPALAFVKRRDMGRDEDKERRAVGGGRIESRRREMGEKETRNGWGVYIETHSLLLTRRNTYSDIVQAWHMQTARRQRGRTSRQASHPHTQEIRIARHHVRKPMSDKFVVRLTVEMVQGKTNEHAQGQGPAGARVSVC